jgi:hypothetical protein
MKKEVKHYKLQQISSFWRVPQIYWTSVSLPFCCGEKYREEVYSYPPPAARSLALARTSENAWKSSVHERVAYLTRAKVTRFSRPSACMSRECTASLSTAIFLPLVPFAALGLLEWCRHNYWFAYLNQRGFTVVQDHVKNDCKIYTLCDRLTGQCITTHLQSCESTPTVKRAGSPQSWYGFRLVYLEHQVVQYISWSNTAAAAKTSHLKVYVYMNKFNHWQRHVMPWQTTTLSWRYLSLWIKLSSGKQFNIHNLKNSKNIHCLQILGGEKRQIETPKQINRHQFVMAPAKKLKPPRTSKRWSLDAMLNIGPNLKGPLLQLATCKRSSR